MGVISPGFHSLRRSLLARPEVTAIVVIVVSWIAIVASPALVHVVQDPRTAAAMASMPGMAMSDQKVTSESTISVGLLAWIVMPVAMMGPAARGGLRYTGLNSLVWRRRRAMAEFAAGYLVLWCVI